MCTINIQEIKERILKGGAITADESLTLAEKRFSLVTSGRKINGGRMRVHILTETDKSVRNRTL